MTKLRRGELHGLPWYEVPLKSVAQYAPPVEGATAGAVLCPPGAEPSDAMLEGCQCPGRGHCFLSDIGVTVARADAIPGFHLGYARFDWNDEAVDAWIRSRFEIPDELDLSFQWNENRRSLHVSAWTERKGLRIAVRKRVPPLIPLDESLPPLIAYFMRNARRPDGDAGPSCGAHLQAVLDRLDANGVREMAYWLEGFARNGRGSSRSANAISIPGAMLPGTGLNRLDVSKGHDADLVTGDYHFETGGGWTRLVDDVQGANLTVRAEMPDSVMAALPGRTLDQILPIGWFSHLVVKQATAHDARTVRIRSTTTAVPLTLPDPKPISDEEARSRISRHFRESAAPGRNPLFDTVTAAAATAVAGLDPQSRLGLLDLLTVRHKVDLDAFGMPGWEISAKQGKIGAERSPQLDGEETMLA